MASSALASPAPGTTLPGAVPSAATIDALAERARQLFHVPGLALGIVQDGRLVYAHGYGQRDVASNAPVDASTLFGIGSITKSFTAAALALQVDAGRLHWDDRVIDHLPELQMADPIVTRELTVRDLLSHRTGLGQGEGDLMLFSRSRFTRAEAVHNVRFLQPKSSFRSQFAYNNLMVVVAGALLERVAGASWERTVQQRVLGPLGMTGCVADPAVAENGDVATGYAEIGTTLVPVVPFPLLAAAPAGGMRCDVSGMVRWMLMQLGGGSLDGQVFLSKAQQSAMWTPQILLPTSPFAAQSRQHFRAYGLGWFLEDFNGTERVWHSGTVAGMVSLVSLLPERQSGIVVLTNAENSNATNGLVAALTQMLTGGAPFDWLGEYKHRQDVAAAARDKRAAEAPGSPQRPFVHLPASELSDYAGTYRDAWRGAVAVELKADRLRLGFDQADGLEGELHALPHDLFVVHWDNRAAFGSDDAYVQFRRDSDGRVDGASMKLVGSDFSFDVQDLELKRMPAG